MVDLPLSQLLEAHWNSNEMDEAMLERLRESIRRYGLVENLVVRPLEDSAYEVLSGNQRLRVLRQLEFSSALCLVIDLDDAHARLLGQALNHLGGEDDLGLRAGLLRQVLVSLSQEEVLAVLPETAQSLQAITSLGQEALAGYLENWQKAQVARLKHLTFQLTISQLEVVEEALTRVLPLARHERESPNARGTALYLLCKSYLEVHRV